MTTIANPLFKVSYSRLTRQARDTIRWSLWRLDGPVATIADYIRHYSGSGEWRGDRCGCVDDRCIGYHHEGYDDCQCLPVLVDEFVAELNPSVLKARKLTS